MQYGENRYRSADALELFCNEYGRGGQFIDYLHGLAPLLDEPESLAAIDKFPDTLAPGD